MFSRAFEKATAFTHPVLFGIQRMDGTTAGGCGSYVMLNEDGWALTAAHVVEPLWWNEVNREKILQFEKEWTEVENNPRNSSINKKMVELKKLLSKFKFGGDEAKSCNFYWGEKGRIIESCIMHDSADLALLKFKSSDQDYITNYPVIKKPTSLIGTMLCRIGFPFVTVDVKENEGNQILFNIRDGKEPSVPSII